MEAVQERGGMDLAEGECVLVPARVSRICGGNAAGNRIELETEEPPESGESWPLLTLDAGYSIGLGSRRPDLAERERQVLDAGHVQLPGQDDEAA